MSILHFLDKSVIIRRLQTVTTGSVTSATYAATMTIDMHIQSASNSESNEYFAAYSASHKAWIDEDISIKEGDQVVDPGGRIYEVTYIVPKQYEFAINRHQEVYLSWNNSENL